MQPQNYTPIDDLVRKHTSSPGWGGPKESEPPRTTESIKIHESGEHEIIDEDVKQHIDVHTEKVVIPDEVKAAGVEHVDEAAQLPQVHIPISDDKVIPGLHAPITSSFRWLATLSMYILHQAHQTIKMIKGKAVRVEE